MKRVRFSGFPPRLRDEASLKTVFSTFGDVVSLHLTVGTGSEPTVSGTCRFASAEEAGLTCSAMRGLQIGSYTIQVERDENGSTEGDEGKRKEEKRKLAELKPGKKDSNGPLPSSSSMIKPINVDGTKKVKAAVALPTTKRSDGPAANVNGEPQKKKKPRIDDGGISVPSKTLPKGSATSSAVEIKPSSTSLQAPAGDLKRQPSTASEQQSARMKKDDPLMTSKKQGEASLAKKPSEDSSIRDKAKTSLQNAMKTNEAAEAQKKKEAAEAVKKNEAAEALKKKEAVEALRKKEAAELSRKTEAAEAMKKKKVKDESSSSLATPLAVGHKANKEGASQKEKSAKAAVNEKQPETKKLSADGAKKEKEKQSLINSGSLKSSAAPAEMITKSDTKTAEDIKKAEVAKAMKQLEASVNVRPQADSDSAATTVQIDEIQESAAKLEVWEEYMDERYGVPYYFNPETNETVWEAPAGAQIVKVISSTGTDESSPSADTNEMVLKTAEEQPYEKPVEEHRTTPAESEQQASVVLQRTVSEGAQRTVLEGVHGAVSTLQRKASEGTQRIAHEGAQRVASDGTQRATSEGPQRTAVEGVQRTASNGTLSGPGNQTGEYSTSSTLLDGLSTKPPSNHLTKTEVGTSGVNRPVQPVTAERGSGDYRKSASISPGSGNKSAVPQNLPSSNRSTAQPSNAIPIATQPSPPGEKVGSTGSGSVNHLKEKFGFIRTPGSKDDMFFHFDELVPGYEPRLGDEVEFEIGFNSRRMQPMAIAVRRARMMQGSLSQQQPQQIALNAASTAPNLGPRGPPSYIRRDASTSSLPPTSSRGARFGRSRDGSTRDPSFSRSRGRRSRSPPVGTLRRQHSSPAAMPSSGPPVRWHGTSGGPAPVAVSGKAAVSVSGGATKRKDHEWVCYFDRTTNLPYWHCLTTKETTWTNPYS